MELDWGTNLGAPSPRLPSSYVEKRQTSAIDSETDARWARGNEARSTSSATEFHVSDGDELSWPPSWFEGPNTKTAGTLGSDIHLFTLTLRGSHVVLSYVLYQ